MPGGIWSPRGENHYRWNGGVHHREGYRYIFRPSHPLARSDGYIAEHRVVYEEYHKCCVLSWSAVHHINGIKDDNRVENLEGMTWGKHIGLHKKEAWKLGLFKDPTHHLPHIPRMTEETAGRRCIDCSSTSTYKTKTGYLQWYGNYKDGFRCSKCQLKINNQKRGNILVQSISQV